MSDFVSSPTSKLIGGLLADFSHISQREFVFDRFRPLITR